MYGLGFVYAQTAPPVAVTPGSATMMIGETRSFRAVDGSGRFLRHVQWTVSQTGIVEISSGDEVEVTALTPGSVTLTARTTSGVGEAHVEVAGKALAPGTVLWSGGEIPGCHPTNITQAVPTASGPDLYEQSECPDGTYIRAFTAQGVVLWRRKMESVGHTPANSDVVSAPASSATPLNTHPRSICDSVSVGAKAEAVRALVRTRNLSAPDSMERVWVFEEAGVECRLWFGKDSDVVKKRKTIIAE
jgi:hypothetical protein